MSRTGLIAQSNRPVVPEPEQKAEEMVPTSAPGTPEVPAASSTAEDEELVDYEASPEHTNMEINVVHFSDDYWAIPEEETAHLDFGPREAIFQKPKDSDNHLKALYVRGHINGKANFSYARGQWGNHEFDALFTLQEAWRDGRRAHQDEHDGQRRWRR